MNQALRRLPVVLVVIAVLALGLRGEPVPQWFAHQDKVHHVLAFAVLALTWRRATPRVRLLTVVCASVALGGVIELAQAFMPARTASVFDVAGGAVGACLGWWCAWGTQANESSPP